MQRKPIVRRAPVLLLSLCAAMAQADDVATAPLAAKTAALADTRPAQPLAASKGASKKVAAKSPPTASEPAPAAKPVGDVQLSGMSIMGNEDSPKSLVIVPWKGSRLGDAPGLSRMLDDSTKPVDRDVFLRELSYYHIKVDSK